MKVSFKSDRIRRRFERGKSFWYPAAYFATTLAEAPMKVQKTIKDGCLSSLWVMADAGGRCSRIPGPSLSNPSSGFIVFGAAERLLDATMDIDISSRKKKYCAPAINTNVHALSHVNSQSALLKIQVRGSSRNASCL